MNSICFLNENIIWLKRVRSLIRTAGLLAFRGHRADKEALGLSKRHYTSFGLIPLPRPALSRHQFLTTSFEPPRLNPSSLLPHPHSLTYDCPVICLFSQVHLLPPPPTFHSLAHHALLLHRVASLLDFHLQQIGSSHRSATVGAYPVTSATESLRVIRLPGPPNLDPNPRVLSHTLSLTY